MGRNILLITTDQMRYDALGCNGGQVARTPVIDSIAAQGLNYHRAHNQNVVCMPARATIITGQHVGTHGVWMNGVSLPEDTPTMAHWLAKHGYRTAIVGKAHFEPWLGNGDEFYENRMAKMGETGPHRGFEHLELANHFDMGHAHYDVWLANEYPELAAKRYPAVTKERMQNMASTGVTGAIQVSPSDIPTELYHTNWVADRTIAWLSTLDPDENWFIWMSFPDPHHPWDPPESEKHRLDWRNVPLPDLWPESRAEAVDILQQKPKHWMGYYDGSLWANLESPRGFKPCDMTADQVREINAWTHIENELIDDACGRVMDFLAQQQLDASTDIFFTSDHGELQGDYGLLFKGAYHVDSLMRLPMIWRPAPDAGIAPEEIAAPVGHVDLAKTFCAVANIDEPGWVEGQALPTSNADAQAQHRQRQMTQWESEHGPVNMSLNTIYRNDWVCTAYAKGAIYNGDEGELYNLVADPGSLYNLWDDPGYAGIRDDLVADLNDHLPAARQPKLERKAPV